MQNTAEHLKARGYQLKYQTEVWEQEGPHPVARHQFHLINTESELLLETLISAGKKPRYFLQLINHHGLGSFPFPLDSWMHRSNQVEFKYYSLPEDGRGLSLILALNED